MLSPMIHYLFRLSNKKHLFGFKKQITKKGLKQIYTIQETETSTWLLGGFAITPLCFKGTPFTDATLIEESLNPTPDWDKQAELFSPYFSDGLIQLDLTPYGTCSKIQFHPGEGFGDLSHPTTEIMLKLASPYIRGNTVLDIGSGNGILTIAASALGAKKAYGVEIDPLALEHSHKNLSINEVESVSFHELDNLPSFTPNVILCNMITSEQEAAYQFYPHFHAKPLTIIISGILASQKEAYLQIAQERGWSLVLDYEKDEWLGFVFQTY